MLNTIKQLKQQNEAAFNFALAGIITFCLAIIGLAYLFNDVMEQKQIAKQVGNLQMIESRIQTIIRSKKLTYGEKVAFLEFENNVNTFNKQWFEFKGKYHYSTKTIKEVDEVWQRINDNAQIIVAKKKELMILKTVVDKALVNFKVIYKINDELVNVLLGSNINSHQLAMAKELAVLFIDEESEFASIYIEDVNVVRSEDDFGFGNLHSIRIILNGFLSGESNLGIKKIEDVKIREMIKNYMTLVDKKINSDRNTILSMSPMLFQFFQAKNTIYRDSPELKSALSKLNNHQLNKGLIALVICIWLVFFACVFGFLRALTSSEEFL